MDLNFTTSVQMWKQNLTKTYLFQFQMQGHKNHYIIILSFTAVSCTCPLVTTLLEYWSNTWLTNQLFPLEKKNTRRASKQVGEGHHKKWARQRKKWEARQQEKQQHWGRETEKDWTVIRRSDGNKQRRQSVWRSVKEETTAVVKQEKISPMRGVL